MKMALDTASGVNLVKSYERGSVKIRDRSYRTSLIVFPDRLITDWEAREVDELGNLHFSPIIEHRPEVLILGTGETQVFPEPTALTLLMDMGIGFEVMDNPAACRTYNILLSEERRVALALLFPGSGDTQIS